VAGDGLVESLAARPGLEPADAGLARRGKELGLEGEVLDITAERTATIFGRRGGSLKMMMSRTAAWTCPASAGWSA